MTTDTNEFVPAADPKHPYWDAGNPGHAAEVQRVAQLFEAAAADGNDPNQQAAERIKQQLAGGAQQDGEKKEQNEEQKEQQPAPFKLNVPAVRAGVSLEQDAVTGFGELAKSESLDQKGAQALLDVYGELAEKAPAGGWTEQDSHQALERLWGSNAPGHLARVQTFVATKPALAAWLDSTGAGNDPAVLSVLHVLARSSEGSVGEYRAAIDKAYLDANDPRHREAVQAIRIMYALGLR